MESSSLVRVTEKRPRSGGAGGQGLSAGSRQTAYAPGSRVRRKGGRAVTASAFGDTRDQVYGGIASERPETDRALRETCGAVRKIAVVESRVRGVRLRAFSVTPPIVAMGPYPNSRVVVPLPDARTIPLRVQASRRSERQCRYDQRPKAAKYFAGRYRGNHFPNHR